MAKFMIILLHKIGVNSCIQIHHTWQLFQHDSQESRYYSSPKTVIHTRILLFQFLYPSLIRSEIYLSRSWVLNQWNIITYPHSFTKIGETAQLLTTVAQMESAILDVVCGQPLCHIDFGGILSPRSSGDRYRLWLLLI